MPEVVIELVVDFRNLFEMRSCYLDVSLILTVIFGQGYSRLKSISDLSTVPNGLEAVICTLFMVYMAGIMFQVDSIERNFREVFGDTSHLGFPYRKCLLNSQRWVVECHGYAGFECFIKSSDFVGSKKQDSLIVLEHT